MHAYGLAIDLNPFQNPYKQGSLVIPELSTSYLDRSYDRPGMVHHGDLVWQAFRDIGWGWGGDWSSPKDYTHFSSNGHERTVRTCCASRRGLACRNRHGAQV
jgi:hypothetical protein